MELTHGPSATITRPVFLSQAEQLIEILRGFSIKELVDFMDISEKLATQTAERIQHWQLPFTPDNATPALFAFTGGVYDGLAAQTLTAADRQFAQKHLRILSGLYGLLRPLDLIQPYRLEMGRPLKTGETNNLYGFWKETITAELNRRPGDLLVNLASQEYFKAIDPKALTKQVVSPVFKDEKNGVYKIISFYAKRARGAMARFLIENRVADAEGLTGFDCDGYSYAAELSTEASPVFIRPEQP
jgi:cytoplasmic iron level regulating protein YaaA (DUF328/UPF0246 family)